MKSYVFSIILVCIAMFIVAIFYSFIKVLINTSKRNTPSDTSPTDSQLHSPIPKKKVPSVNESFTDTSSIETVVQADEDATLIIKKENYLSGLHDYSIGLMDIPEEYWSEDILISAIESNISDIKLIPPKKKTFNLCAIATLLEIKERYIPKDFGVQYTEICDIDYSLCKKIVDKNPKLLIVIPKEYQTQELIDIAIKSEHWALSLLPISERTYQRCMIAFERSPHAIDYFPLKFLSDEICREAIVRTPLTFKSIPNEFMNNDLITFAVTTAGNLLKYVDPVFINEEVCVLAVKNNFLAMKFVPHSCRTPSVLQTFSACVERNIIANTVETLSALLNYISADEYSVASQGFKRHLYGLKRSDLEHITRVQSDSIEVDLHNMHKEQAKGFVYSMLSNVNVGIVNQLVFIHGFHQGTVLLNMLRGEIKHPRIKHVYRDKYNNGITIFQIA